MNKSKFLQGLLGGGVFTAIILAGAFFLINPAISANGQNTCGKICGDGFDCINAECPICSQDETKKTWSCVG